MQENKQEKKVLAIVTLILGILALILSWVPIVNNIAGLFAGIAIILGLIAIFINRKSKKTLSIVGTVISIIALVVVIATQGMYSSALNKASDSIASSQKKAESDFKWTLSDYDALVVGDSLTGAGGTNYDELITKFGKPSNSSDSQSGDSVSRLSIWDNIGSTNYKSVSLTFNKQADGTWLLSYKNQTGLSE